jgi:hypothetical protein
MATVPVDGRRQFDGLSVMMANHSLGRAPLAGVERIGPDAYVLAGSWPAPRTVSTGPSSRPEPEPERPKTPGQILWPNLGGANGRP